MGSVAVRAAVAVFFVIAWFATCYLGTAITDENSATSDHGAVLEAAFLAFYGAMTLFTGVIVRWPALVLPFVIFALLLPLGVNPEDSDGWTYAWLYAVPAGFLSLPVLLVGCLVGSAAGLWQRHRRAAA